MSLFAIDAIDYSYLEQIVDVPVSFLRFTAAAFSFFCRFALFSIKSAVAELLKPLQKTQLIKHSYNYY